MSIGYKCRKWQAVLTVSASGPEFSPVLEEGGRFFRPRMAADLRYTTADVDFIETHFRNGDYDSGQQEIRVRLRNPTKGEFDQALDGIEQWLGSFQQQPDWDGGAVLFCFAGHGREGDGGLVLSDGILAPSEFIARLTRIAATVSAPGRLRISTLLDSCHSGAFTTELLDACFNQHAEVIVPFHVYASCMEDEFAWEESGLGHGVFTYCFSVREPASGSLVAKAVQPDNTFGPSLAIAGGDLGCSFLTAGAQNPVRYWNGTGHLEVGHQGFDIFKDGKALSLDEMRSRLKHERNGIVKVIRPMQPDRHIGTGVSDEEMRLSIHETIKFLRDPLILAERHGTTSDSSPESGRR